MNKADLVNLVAARTELTKTDVSLVVDAAIETIVDSVVEGKKVSILGFGSFEPPVSYTHLTLPTSPKV